MFLRIDKLPVELPASSFAPNYAPEEILEIAPKLYQKAKNL
jgi:hypothetical protein